MSMPPAVLTRSYNNARTGSTDYETVLTPELVSRCGLGRIFSLNIGDDARGAEAQPLIVPNVRMPDGQLHDVVYVCSLSNRVWAFDAQTGAPLWPQPIELGRRPVDRQGGVLSTPVIDLDSQTLYVVSYASPDGSVASAAHRLHALSLSNGSSQAQPAAIQGHMRTSGGAEISLNHDQMQRAALLLVPPGDRPAQRKTLFVAFSGGDRPREAHGWVVAFQVPGLKRQGALALTPRSWGGGVSQTAQGPCANPGGDVYLMTGDGGWDGIADFGSSLLKLRANPHLVVTGWFPPTADVSGRGDGASAPVLLNRPGLVVAATRDGDLAVLDQATLTRQGGAATSMQPLQGSPVFWDGPEALLFGWPERGRLSAWAIDARGRLHPRATASEQAVGGGLLCLSAAAGSPQRSALVWAVANVDGDQAVLRAYEASRLQSLWESPPFSYNPFGLPVVWDGKVYVATYDGRVDAYAPR
jgi:outer membrane protein assembly factor BamB